MSDEYEITFSDKSGIQVCNESGHVSVDCWRHYQEVQLHIEPHKAREIARALNAVADSIDGRDYNEDSESYRLSVRLGDVDDGSSKELDIQPSTPWPKK